ncbi:hypothetical protein BU16DRAFT_283637 [Lophium mytilinum]|uniref:Uncharacterized protein n=1 Tax=Lophium mytilinum TaxID=390894 RepID=A0A6A6R8N8_9PEZI|nr:hypothetical protein BU16DRAFT_283637 [Lophium mytilinum]
MKDLTTSTMSNRKALRKVRWKHYYIDHGLGQFVLVYLRVRVNRRNELSPNGRTTCMLPDDDARLYDLSGVLGLVASAAPRVTIPGLAQALACLCSDPRARGILLVCLLLSSNEGTAASVQQALPICLAGDEDGGRRDDSAPRKGGSKVARAEEQRI